MFGKINKYAFTGALFGLINFSTVTSVSAQEITFEKLPNGIEYQYYHMKDAGRTAVAITWENVLPSEGMHIATARLGLNLILNGGAGGKPPDEIISEFEDLDGGSKLFGQPREIRGFIVAPDENLEKAAQISNDVLARPNLDENWFEREKKKLVDNARNRKNKIYGLAWNLSRNIMFGDHPYAQYWSLTPVKGIEGITLPQVRDWHKNSFSADGMKIAVAGSATPENIGPIIENALKGLPTQKLGDPLTFDAPNIPAKTILFHKPDLPKSLVLIFGALPSDKEGNAISFNLATGVLGYGQQSRLFKAVRSGLRAAYGFRASMTRFTRDHRVLTMSGEVETALLNEALAEIDETYETFRTSGVGILEFPFAKRFYRQRIDKEKKKASSVAFMMMRNILNEQPKEDLTELEVNIDKVGRGEINEFIAKTYPEYSGMLKIIVTPDENAVKDACVITAIAQWQDCMRN